LEALLEDMIMGMTVYRFETNAGCVILVPDRWRLEPIDDAQKRRWNARADELFAAAARRAPRTNTAA
jgi:hypothetical protein